MAEAEILVSTLVELSGAQTLCHLDRHKPLIVNGGVSILSWFRGDPRFLNLWYLGADWQMTKAKSMIDCFEKLVLFP